MQFKTFSVPLLGGEEMQEEMNRLSALAVFYQLPAALAVG